MASKDDIRHWRRRLESLESERRKGWEDDWRDLARHFLPRRSRFLNQGEPTNQGGRKNKLYNNAGILARRTLASGMQSGLTSPARPWFSLTLQDEDLARRDGSKAWLHYVYEKMVNLFNRSNFYDQIHLVYDELATFGTAAMIVEEDDLSVIRCRTLTAGEFYLDTGSSGRVDTLYRRLRMTARQMVEAWGEESPERVRVLADNDSAEWLTVLHVVELNPAYTEGAKAGAERRYISVYLLLEGGDELLEESGYFEFPALCPRWNTTASDVYGSSPAMEALGDCRLLQAISRSGWLALEKEVNPPLAGPPLSGLGYQVDASPGAYNPISVLGQQQTVITSLYQVRANLPAVNQEKASLTQQIREMFFNDLFLMISQVNRQMTATEVAERNAEKMLLLGPVLDRLRSELFQPLIERVFGIMSRQGLIPEPPEELQGQEIKIEFISILAQAQKQSGIAAINNTVAFAGSLAQMSPGVLDKVNFDEAIDEVAAMNGVPPSLIRSDEEVARMRAERQQQMEQAQQMQQMRQGLAMAESGAKAARDSGLTQAMAETGGLANAAQP